MNFDVTEEQQLLADSVEAFVRDNCDFDAHRAILKAELGYSKDNWNSFAELGWLAIPFAEEHGGLDFGATELAILFEKFGSSLVTEPYLATVVMGGKLIESLGNEQQRTAWLERIISGDAQLALAYAEPKGRYCLSAIETRASGAGDAWSLSGHKAMVLNAPAADMLIVSAQTDAGLSLFLVDPKSTGVRLNSYRTLDGSRAAEVHLDQAGAELLGTDGRGLEALQAVIDSAALCVCSEAVGAIEKLLWKTTEYLRTRKQFGLPLSKFQALQHRATEMFIEVEQAKSIVAMAIMATESGTGVARAVSAAKARVGRAAKLVGEEAIQMHGGIGVTEELDIGHYVRRLIMIENLFGTRDWHLQRFSQS